MIWGHGVGVVHSKNSELCLLAVRDLGSVFAVMAERLAALCHCAEVHLSTLE